MKWLRHWRQLVATFDHLLSHMAKQPTNNGCVQVTCTNLRQLSDVPKRRQFCRSVGRTRARKLLASADFVRDPLTSHRPLLPCLPLQARCLLCPISACSIPLLPPPSRTIPKTRPVSKFHKIPRLSNEVQLDVLLSWTMTIRLRTTKSTASLQTKQKHISLRKIMHAALQISNFVPHIFSIGLYTVSQKNCANLFLSELRQISTNFDNFWQKGGMRLKLCEVHSFFTSSNLHRHTTALNADVPNCYTMLNVVICNKLSNDLISTQ